MLKTILANVPRDTDYPERAFNLTWLKMALDGKLYDNQEHEFHEEKGASGEYIPVRARRPSVIYGLPRIVVEDSVSLLFSEAHFPTIQCDDKPTVAALMDLMKETRIDEVMVSAAIRGSVGSIAVLMRVLKNRVFFNVLDTVYLTPTWLEDAPDTLQSVTERYKLKGADLRDAGYTIADDDLTTDFWFQRTWDDTNETWFVPVKVASISRKSPQPPAIDVNRTVSHALGFVPMVWIKNLPGGDEIDGACTFRAAVDASIEIDYQLSQVGRGLKYSSDPTLLIKEPAATDGDIIKGAGNALIVAQDGDAKLLEIGGTAAAAVMEYVRDLRTMALESIHGNRANADKLSATQSGRALEMMNQGLIWLADRLRASYGEHGLLPLMRMVVQASAKVSLVIMGKPAPSLVQDVPLSLKWPRWYQPTPEERSADASTLVALRAGGLMSRETAIRQLADDYDIEDVAAELLLIQADQKAQDERLGSMAAATTAAETVPS
jgi:hypothetical protein